MDEEIVLAKIKELINLMENFDGTRRDFSTVIQTANAVLNGLYEIKNELESKGTRPTIILKGDK